jgi:prophage regulatory protein
VQEDKRAGNVGKQVGRAECWSTRPGLNIPSYKELDMSIGNGNSLRVEGTTLRGGAHAVSPTGTSGIAHRAITDLPAVGHVRQSQLIPTIVPFSSATLWRRVNSGDFPKPVKLSERVTAWRVEDIRAWMRDRSAVVCGHVSAP